jgi:hypothetical protein
MPSSQCGKLRDARTDQCGNSEHKDHRSSRVAEQAQPCELIHLFDVEASNKARTWSTFLSVPGSVQFAGHDKEGLHREALVLWAQSLFIVMFLDIYNFA